MVTAEGVYVLTALALVALGMGIGYVACLRLGSRFGAGAQVGTSGIAEYIAVLAHELSGPIANVGVAAQILAKELHGRMAERSALAIAEEARHMGSMLEGLAALSQYETGRLTLSVRPVDLASLVRGGIGLVPPREHQLVVDVPDDPVIVSADDRRVRQVIRNLIENAAKYSDVGTQVEVRVGTTPDRRQAVVQVIDHGRGVPPSERPRLFDKFTRLSTSQGTRGSGLGLFLCKAIVQEHGGRIWGEWPVGGGSIFSFSLPLALRGAAAREEVHAG